MTDLIQWWSDNEDVYAEPQPPGRRGQPGSQQLTTGTYCENGVCRYLGNAVRLILAFGRAGTHWSRQENRCQRYGCAHAPTPPYPYPRAINPNLTTSPYRPLAFSSFLTSSSSCLKKKLPSLQYHEKLLYLLSRRICLNVQPLTLLSYTFFSTVCFFFSFYTKKK